MRPKGGREGEAGWRRLRQRPAAVVRARERRAGTRAEGVGLLGGLLRVRRGVLQGRPPRSTANDAAVAPPPRPETATSMSPFAAATDTVPLEEKVTAGDQPRR